MTPRDLLIDYILGRIDGRVGEGTLLPPRMAGGSLRVPVVTNLRILKTQDYMGGTQFTLSWVEPGVSSGNMAHYSVLVSDANDPVTTQQGAQVAHPPAVVKVQSITPARVILRVQTVLKNGMVSDFEYSPSVVGISSPAVVTASEVPAINPRVITYPSGTNNLTPQILDNSRGPLVAQCIPTTTACTIQLPTISEVRKQTLYVKHVPTTGASTIVLPYFTETLGGLPQLVISVYSESRTLYAPESGHDWTVI